MEVEGLFDFQTYLHNLSSYKNWKVEKLGGGIVNVTVRVIKPHENALMSDDGHDIKFSEDSTPESTKIIEVNDHVSALDVTFSCDPSNSPDKIDASLFMEHESMILKYAPPYIAAVGPDAPFDIFRQTIEARALSLFSTTSSSSQPSIPPDVCTTSGVEVPRLFFHDSSNHVLAISDLGRLENLSDHFLSFLTPTAFEHEEICMPAEGHQLDLGLVSKHYSSIGQRLGTFLALLHSPHTLTHIHSSSRYASSPSFLYNPSREPLVFSEAIAPLQQHFLKFTSLISSSEASHLYHALEENFTRDIDDQEEGCLMMGDCWTGAVLLEPVKYQDVRSRSDHHQQCHPQHEHTPDRHRRTDSGISMTPLDPAPTIPRIAMIDWEFASLHRARGFDGDIAQLLAHFLLHQILACHHGNRGLYCAVTGSILGLVQEYESISKAEGTLWAKEVTGDVGESKWRERFLLSLGAEMINAACWREWPCRCCSGEQDRGAEKRGENCELVRWLVGTGIKVLRSALEHRGFEGEREGQRGDVYGQSLLEKWVRIGMVDFDDPSLMIKEPASMLG